MIKKVVIGLAVIFLLAGLFSAQTQAQVATAIKISPVRIEEVVDPGQVLTESILVTNDADIERTMHIYVRDFKAEGEEGKPKLLEPGSEDGAYLSSWIEVNQNDIVFGPHEQKEIYFTVKVPANIGPGGYYGAVAVGNVAKKAEIKSEDKGAAVSVAQQTNCLLLFTVRGEVDERAIVKDFVTDKRTYRTPFKVEFTTRIENQGNVHVKPHGLIEIYDMFGSKKVSIPVNETGKNVLPFSVRKFVNQWEGKFGFGKYKAQLILSYGMSVKDGGTGKKSLSAATYFWIIPFNIIGPTIGGLLFLLIAIFIGARIYKNRAVRRAMQEAGIGHLPHQLVAQRAGQTSVAHISLLILSFVLLFALLGLAVFFLFFA